MDDVEINVDLLELYTMHLATRMPSRFPDPTEKCFVTYALSPASSSVSNRSTITLLENPYLISGAGTTGLRTWEAALALSEWLILSNVLRPTDRVVELGAGTGLVSLVAARLGVQSVLATDGDQGVCEALIENVKLNSLQSEVSVVKRLWAGARECPENVDLLVGADVTYDPSAIPFLVAELVFLFRENPKMRAVISATVRNEETLDGFRAECEKGGLQLVETVWELPEPKIFWYEPRAEIRIMKISPAWKQ